MATYNRAHFIEETLLSIKNQTYQNWECLIIDDGGTDNTLNVIKPFLKQDQRFRFFKRLDIYEKGLPGCRNYGLDIANGNFIIFFDDDDIAHPLNLELCVKELEDSTIYFCRYQRNVFNGKFKASFDYSKEYKKFCIDIKKLPEMLTNELPFNSCVVMWRKECFKIHRFKETLMYAEEWELYSRILSDGYKGISIDKCLFYGRKHSNSNTGEFYSGSPIRIASKKEAIWLVVQNLVNKQLLSSSLLKYLAGYAISFRDLKLLNDILTISKTTSKNKLYLKLKFHLFLFWKLYIRAFKLLK